MHTEGKKENILGLGWNGVVRPLAKAADPFSWILFVAFLVLIVVAVVARFASGPLHQAYDAKYPLFWYGAWVLLVISTVGPIFNLSRERNEVPIGVLIGVCVAHVLVFIILSVVTLSQEGANTQAITTLLAATVAAGMVGIGWVVQHNSSARASRRAHTFNILMQSRLSKEFQEQVRLRSSYYTAGRAVAAEDVALIGKNGYEARLKLMADELALDLSRALPAAHVDIQREYDQAVALVKLKHESLGGVRYLLNFYEFMSAGIKLRELDEAMLRETVRDIAVFLWRDTTQIVLHTRLSQDDVFRNLEEVVGQRWSPQVRVTQNLL